jgi:hypothetical protein
VSVAGDVSTVSSVAVGCRAHASSWWQALWGVHMVSGGRGHLAGVVAMIDMCYGALSH